MIPVISVFIKHVTGLRLFPLGLGCVELAVSVTLNSFYLLMSPKRFL